MLKGFSVQQVLSGAGPANGVLFLNGSNVATASSGLTFNGTTLGTTGLSVSAVSGNTEIVHNVVGSGTAARTNYTRASVIQFYVGLGAWSGTDTYEIANNAGVMFSMDANKNGTIGAGAVATTATDGFLYIPTCAGVPTGVPTAKTGFAPIVVDTTNNRWYFYSGGAWQNAGP